MTAQVAHDILSPLASLEMSLEDLSSLPEDIRLIVRSALGRIQDISSDLLQDYKIPALNQNNAHSIVSSTESDGEQNAVVLLSSLIGPLLSEKRTQYRTKLGVKIQTNLTPSSYGLFACVEPKKLKRILSNLVNNAVIHGVEETGLITVELSEEDGQIVIRCSDDGKGIGSKGLEQNKKYGEDSVARTGLGLPDARSAVASWGGKLKIESKMGYGTTVSILLPKAKPPSWFVPSINISHDTVVTVLDDDVSIHHVWDSRFDAIGSQDQGITLRHFSTTLGLAQSMHELGDKSTLFLIDYELIGQAETGLDLIERLRIANRSLLVTSRFEDPNILRRCRKLGIKLLPKSLAGVVPIQLDTSIDASVIVLLDNDVLVRETWSMWAKRKQINIRVFGNELSLVANLDQFDKKTLFYVDYELETDRNGADVTKTLFGLGYENLILVTGHSPDQIPSVPWVKSIRGKKCPWRPAKKSVARVDKQAVAQ